MPGVTRAVRGRAREAQRPRGRRETARVRRAGWPTGRRAARLRAARRLSCATPPGQGVASQSRYSRCTQLYDKSWRSSRHVARTPRQSPYNAQLATAQRAGWRRLWRRWRPPRLTRQRARRWRRRGRCASHAGPPACALIKSKPHAALMACYGETCESLCALRKKSAHQARTARRRDM
jgi:hypothetical protein